MPAGMQIFDGLGNVTLDVSDSVAKYLGTVSVPASNGVSDQTGTVTDNGFLSGTLWWLVTLPPTVTLGSKVTVSLSGDVLTWVAKPDCPAFTLYYGVS